MTPRHELVQGIIQSLAEHLSGVASHTLTEAEVTAAAKRQYEALPTDYFSRAAGTDKLKPPAQPINASISDYWIDHAELALLPPVVLFVVGWTVLWAGRGFKRQ